MNKPIRRVAFVAMIMFALLLANVTYIDDLPAGQPGRQPRTDGSATPSSLRTGVRSWRPARTEIAKTKASDDRFQLPAGLSRRRTVLGGDRLLLLRPRPDRAGELLQHPAGRHRRLAVRPPAGGPGHRPLTGGRERADHHRAPGPEGGRRGARQPEGCRGRPRPQDRRGAGHGDEPDLRREPDRQPRHRGGRTRPGPGWPRPTTGRWPTGRRARSIRPAPPSSW